MKTEITYRKFQKSDRKVIEDIIIEAWHYNELCSSKTAHKMAKVFLSSCLANQTYTQVAILNGKPIGVIMAKNNKIHKCPLKYRINQIANIIELYLCKEGRKIAKIFSNVSKIDEELLKSCNQKTQYEGELAFFAISSKARGRGIGKKMFHDAVEYMKSQKINKFYLFTDTTCNYGFYEHQGMSRCNEKTQNFVIKGQDAKMTFFIYDYSI